MTTSWQSHVVPRIDFSVINHGIGICNINALEVLVLFVHHDVQLH